MNIRFGALAPKFNLSKHAGENLKVITTGVHPVLKLFTAFGELSDQDNTLQARFSFDQGDILVRSQRTVIPPANKKTYDAVIVSEGSNEALLSELSEDAKTELKEDAEELHHRATTNFKLILEKLATLGIDSFDITPL